MWFLQLSASLAPVMKECPLRQSPEDNLLEDGRSPLCVKTHELLWISWLKIPNLLRELTHKHETRGWRTGPLRSLLTRCLEQWFAREFRIMGRGWKASERSEVWIYWAVWRRQKLITTWQNIASKTIPSSVSSVTEPNFAPHSPFSTNLTLLYAPKCSSSLSVSLQQDWFSQKSPTEFTPELPLTSIMQGSSWLHFKHFQLIF